MTIIRQLETKQRPSTHGRELPCEFSLDRMPICQIRTGAIETLASGLKISFMRIFED